MHVICTMICIVLSLQCEDKLVKEEMAKLGITECLEYAESVMNRYNVKLPTPVDLIASGETSVKVNQCCKSPAP